MYICQQSYDTKIYLKSLSSFKMKGFLIFTLFTATQSPVAKHPSVRQFRVAKFAKPETSYLSTAS